MISNTGVASHPPDEMVIHVYANAHANANAHAGTADVDAHDDIDANVFHAPLGRLTVSPPRPIKITIN